MNASEVGLLLTFVWIAAQLGSIRLAKRWDRTREAKWLYASYSVMYAGLIAMVASLWIDQRHPWDHWFAVAGVVLVVASVPWVVWCHRREMRKQQFPQLRPATSARVEATKMTSCWPNPEDFS